MRRVMITAGLWAIMATAAQAAPASRQAPASGTAEAAGKYEAAMATAKQRIAAKDYPAAVEALKTAVVARPDDATALSELSWASHDDEATTTVCGLAASGAPSCVGPLHTEQSSTTDSCNKDINCHEPLSMSVELHCRATLQGDVVTIENNPGKIENREKAQLSKPLAGACAELPWAGKHTLTF